MRRSKSKKPKDVSKKHSNGAESVRHPEHASNRNRQDGGLFIAIFKSKSESSDIQIEANAPPAYTEVKTYLMSQHVERETGALAMQLRARISELQSEYEAALEKRDSVTFEPVDSGTPGLQNISGGVHQKFDSKGNIIESNELPKLEDALKKMRKRQEKAEKINRERMEERQTLEDKAQKIGRQIRVTEIIYEVITAAMKDPVLIQGEDLLALDDESRALYTRMLEEGRVVLFSDFESSDVRVLRHIMRRPEIGFELV